MGGILKNPLPEGQTSENEESVSEFRKQVYKNTQLNAKLTSKNAENASKPPNAARLPKDTLSLKRQQEREEALQWNQKNLAANEITKQQFQDVKIDEPKTPYQGAVDPSGEYYRPDDDDDLNNFSLGEPEVEPEPEPEDLFSEQADGDQGDQQSSSEPLNDEEARHKKFEEMRKKHYNLKDVFKNRRLHNEEDEEDDD
ncbi:GLC8 (YMR311C) [Zygosaccharomyces parabailii]|nr:GLC8 (YMR311C) [Zygosaccharomyces parabailii]CDH12586.1 related to Protein GLC8 [Zygosaccharomyces bailii ISA1307]